jgi:hypothetical protein
VDGIRRRERLLLLGRRAVLTVGAMALVAGLGWQIRGAMVRAQAAALAKQQREDTAPPPAPPKLAEAQKPSAEPAQPQPQPQPPAVKPVKPQQAPAIARVEKPPLLVKLHARYSAQISVDGHDQGNNNMFELKLAPGQHRVLVHHPCCADADQEIQVNPANPDQVYKLRYGAPFPAQFKVVGAPSDARVLVDDVLIGTAADPRPYTMTAPDQHATVKIGDRTLSTTLKAGMINMLDYGQATP